MQRESKPRISRILCPLRRPPICWSWALTGAEVSIGSCSDRASTM